MADRLPPPRSTPWLTSEFIGIRHIGFAECRARWWPGYDCRVKCLHKTQGEHGQAGDEVALDMRLDDFALSLKLMLSVREGHLLDDFIAIRGEHDGYAYTRPSDLTYHSGFPTSAPQLLSKPDECDLLANKQCWIYDSSILAAEKLWTPHDATAVIGLLTRPALEQLLHNYAAIWIRLFDELVHQRAAARTGWAELPHVCARCHGTGFVPIEHPNEP